jgi:SAM-dependent methyltransferase
MGTTSPLPPGALIAPAVTRNREPILAVLRRVVPSRILPGRGLVLEIASGSGEHAIYFAAALPHLAWQPTDPDPEARASIAAYRAAAPLPNLLPPLALDAASPAWPATQADVIVAINMIHIAPWAAAEGLMAGAERLLPGGGVLFLYGPFRERGQHTAPSNAAFDESLRARNREWGVRDLDDVATLASRHGLALEERVAMPANNLSVVFRRRTP